MHFHSLAIVATFWSLPFSTLAVPTPRDDRPEAVANINGTIEQSCTGRLWTAFGIRYDVWIKDPNWKDKPEPCKQYDMVFECMKWQGVRPFVYPCMGSKAHEEKDQHIIIEQRRKGHAQEINFCLAKAYPEVNGFNCPSK